jgi:Fe-S-cluster containining protein
MADKKTEEQATEVEIIKAVRGAADTPVLPVRLEPRDMFCFACHKGVSCWNVCCHGADITLTPCDIIRMSKRLSVRPREFLLEYTVPDIWEKGNLPVAKLKMGGADGRGACAFMTGDGCTIYEDRPVTCRYYPLGLATVKMKGHEKKEDFHFLVKETHCLGHEEDNLQTVEKFRAEQGLADYDRINRGWMDILMKMASWTVLGGPMGKEPTTQTKKMFFMVSTDVDALRDFIVNTKFLDSYDVEPDRVEAVKTDDIALLELGFDWMKNVLFMEDTIKLKEQVLRQAVAQARADTGAT